MRGSMPMSELLRRLNEQGVRRFRDFIADGGSGAPPRALLSDPETSEPLPAAIVPDNMVFTTRYEFGVYLNSILQPLDAATISRDQGLWSAAALFWLDQIRSEEHTSELQSLMCISYAVFCLKKKKLK